MKPIENLLCKFRIVEKSENEFIIERLYIERRYGFAWGKTKDKNVWHRVDRYGDKLDEFFHVRDYRHVNNTITYKTKEAAMHWIENYQKYPIYHYQ